MTESLRQFFGFGGTDTDRRWSVDVSENGVVRVDPEKLVVCDDVQAQIATLNRLIKDGKVELVNK